MNPTGILWQNSKCNSSGNEGSINSTHEKEEDEKLKQEMFGSRIHMTCQ